MSGILSVVIDKIVTAAAGFLIAVLWFDLMFDSQVLRGTGSRTDVRPTGAGNQGPVLPDAVLASIAGYYRRVTTDASPMGQLVGAVMAILVVALVFQLESDEAPVWVSAVSIPAALLATGLAIVRVFGEARRLGRREDSPEVQSALAGSIFREHMVCLAAMSVVLGVQIAGA